MKVKNSYWLLLAFITIAGCTNQEKLPEVPDIVYKEDIMTGSAAEQALGIEGTLQVFRTKQLPWALKVDPDYKHASPEAVERFKDMKVGIRIHWGVYCLNGSNPSWSLWYQKGQLKGGDSYKNSAGLSNDDYVEYMKNYCTLYQDFNPTGYDPEQWAKLFKRAGLKFAVLTTKHHDGFSLFDTQTTVNALKRGDKPGDYEKIRSHYSIMDTPYKKDIVASYCRAMRRAGLAVGLYFSNPDWNDYDFRFGQHNLYRDPAYTRESDPAGWNRALTRHRQQLVELSSNYGTIDILSFDHGLPLEAWPELKETMKQVRSLQPDVMVRHRGIGAWGDHFTPEGNKPPLPGEDSDRQRPAHYRQDRPWCKIGGTGGHPGFNPDHKPIDTAKAVYQLIEICALGGNMQVGFGPDPDGKFHPNVVKFLHEFGDWLKVNGQGIYATRPRDDGNWKEGDNVFYTRSKDDKYLYAIVTEWPGKSLSLSTVKPKANSKITMLGFDKPLQWQMKDALEIKLPRRLQEPQNRPCEHAWVFRIEQ
jgi:alpha-L-fucosidase